MPFPSETEIKWNKNEGGDPEENWADTYNN